MTLNPPQLEPHPLHRTPSLANSNFPYLVIVVVVINIIAVVIINIIIITVCPLLHGQHDNDDVDFNFFLISLLAPLLHLPTYHAPLPPLLPLHHYQSPPLPHLYDTSLPQSCTIITTTTTTTTPTTHTTTPSQDPCAQLLSYAFSQPFRVMVQCSAKCWRGGRRGWERE